MRVRYRILVAAPSRAWYRLVGRPGQLVDSGCCYLPPTTPQPLIICAEIVGLDARTALLGASIEI